MPISYSATMRGREHLLVFPRQSGDNEAVAHSAIIPAHDPLDNLTWS